MCRLVCEKYCAPLIKEGRPFRQFSERPPKTEAPKKPENVLIYRGLHDVLIPNIERPGQWWTFSPKVAANYAEATEVIYSRGQGNVLAGHILIAEVSLDFSDVREAYESFRRAIFREKQLGTVLDLHQIFIPKENFDQIEQTRILSSLVFLLVNEPQNDI